MAETNTGAPDTSGPASETGPEAGPKSGPEKSGPEPELRSLEDILDALSNVGDEGEDGKVSVEEVLTEVGTRSFAPIILVPSLILVSPISGIFGLPTIGAVFILLITVQKLLGRPHVWMPGVIRRRKVTREKLGKAIDWLRRPCAWVDRQTHKRLTVLVSRPARLVTLLMICAVCLIIPALEILPMVTSLFATAISFFAIALLARDGLFTLLGYIWLAGAGGAIWWLVSSGVGG